MSRRRTPPAQHHGHCADRSFRNYGPGNVTHDRRPQTVAVMERSMTSEMSRSRLDSIDRGVRALIQDHRISFFIPPYPFPRSNDWLPFLAALCSASSPYEASRDHDWHQTRAAAAAWYHRRIGRPLPSEGKGHTFESCRVRQNRYHSRTKPETAQQPLLSGNLGRRKPSSPPNDRPLCAHLRR